MVRNIYEASIHVRRKLSPSLVMGAECVFTRLSKSYKARCGEGIGLLMEHSPMGRTTLTRVYVFGNYN